MLTWSIRVIGAKEKISLMTKVYCSAVIKPVSISLFLCSYHKSIQKNSLVFRTFSKKLLIQIPWKSYILYVHRCGKNVDRHLRIFILIGVNMLLNLKKPNYCAHHDLVGVLDLPCLGVHHVGHGLAAGVASRHHVEQVVTTGVHIWTGQIIT